MSNIYAQSSNVRLKRQAFHNQIRSKKRQEYFAAQRKILFETSFLNMLNTNGQNNLGEISIKSIQEIQDHLNNCSIPDYLSINKYLESQNNNNLINENLISQLMQFSTKPQFLNNEHALVLLIKVFNSKKFNSGQWLTEQRVKFYVENVIKQNLFLQDQHHNIWKLNYFSTVCWFLFAIAYLNKDRTLFMLLKPYLQIIQAQGYHQLSMEIVMLLSQLSTYSQLLPSQHFIQHILTREPAYQQSLSYMESLITLLDNYLRYQCQRPHIFDCQDSFPLVINYIKFITKKIKSFSFPSKLKIDLINLAISILRSESDKLILQLSNIPELLQLCQQLFYRAQYAQWEAKSVSFQCFCEILLNPQFLAKISEYIDPARIVHLLVNSITVPDKQFQMNAMICIFELLRMMPNIYKPYLRQSEYLKNLTQFQESEQKEHQFCGKNFSLTDLVRYIYDLISDNQDQEHHFIEC